MFHVVCFFHPYDIVKKTRAVMYIPLTTAEDLDQSLFLVSQKLSASRFLNIVTNMYTGSQSKLILD
jgi:hypothetical protein